MADRIDPLVHAVQASVFQAPGDRPPSNGNQIELPPRDQPVLTARYLRDHPVAAPNARFCVYELQNIAFELHLPERGGGVARLGP